MERKANFSKRLSGNVLMQHVKGPSNEKNKNKTKLQQVTKTAFEANEKNKVNEKQKIKKESNGNYRTKHRITEIKLH